MADTAAQTVPAAQLTGPVTGTLPALEFNTPSPVSLCDGFALFPSLNTFVAGASFGDKQLLNMADRQNVDVYSASFFADLTAFLGICGPAYAVDLQSSGITYSSSNTGTTAAMTVDTITLAGGIEAGVTAQCSVGVTLTQDGNPIIDGNFGSFTVKIDVISLLVQIIADALGDQSFLTQLNNVTSASILSSWGMYDQLAAFSATPAPSGAPQAVLQPQFTIDLSLVPFCDGIPVLDLVSGLDQALQDVGGGFAVGPTVSFGTPTTVVVKNVVLDNGPAPATGYVPGPAGGPISATNPATINFDDQGVNPPLAGAPSTIGVSFEHTVSFSFGIGVFASVTACKLFSWNWSSPSWDLLSLLDIPVPNFGPYDNTLTHQVAASATVTGPARAGG